MGSMINLQSPREDMALKISPGLTRTLTHASLPTSRPHELEPSLPAVCFQAHANRQGTHTSTTLPAPKKAVHQPSHRFITLCLESN